MATACWAGAVLTLHQLSCSRPRPGLACYVQVKRAKEDLRHPNYDDIESRFRMQVG